MQYTYYVYEFGLTIYVNVCYLLDLLIFSFLTYDSHRREMKNRTWINENVFVNLYSIILVNYYIRRNIILNAMRTLTCFEVHLLPIHIFKHILNLYKMRRNKKKQSQKHWFYVYGKMLRWVKCHLHVIDRMHFVVVV